jgi:hypothetical protein
VERSFPKGCGPVHAETASVDDHSTRGEQAGGFHPVQHGIERSRTQAVPVATQLLDERGAVHLALARVVHHMELDRTPDKVTHHIHPLSISDIDIR